VRTFSCNFGRGISCTVYVSDKPPAKGSTHIQNFEWSGKPGPWIMESYKSWIHRVNEQLSKEWNLRLMHVFLLKKNKQEVWVYAPGEPGKKASS
jgi:hypothetical protein